MAQKAKNKKIKNQNSVIKIIIASILTVIVFCGIIVGGYLLIKCIAYVNGDPFDLDKYKADQVQTSIIYRKETEADDYKEYTRLHGDTNRIWVSLDKIPKNMQHAIIALEDKRFNDHHGVDWIRTVGVLVKSSNYGQGGSTITQQLVKNLTDKREVTFVRKFKEILTALNLEKNYSKDEILETYLNTLYLGEGCYGIKTASEKYFGKEVEDLNLAECAVLACITKAPGDYDPLVNPDNNKERQLVCLNNMLEQGFINQNEYDEAVNYKLIFSNTPGFVSHIKESEEIETNKIQSYYVDFIIDSLIKDFQEQYELTYVQAWKKVYYGGLRIYSAENVGIQSQLESIYENRTGFPSEYGQTASSGKVQSSMTIMDYKGRVAAIIGGADKKPSDRCLNRASMSARQPGSSIKPLASYTYAVDNNYITWGSRILDYSGTKREGKLWPRNYGGSTGSGAFVTTQYALKKSLNTVPYRILEKITLKNAYDFVKNKLHFTTLVDGKDDADYSPLCVGGMTNGVTSLEMTAAFAIYGSGGIYYRPYPYFKVTNSDGSIVYFDNTNPTGEQVISPDTAEVMNRMMQTVITEGTGSGYGITGFNTFAKTGTTTDNKDRWFVGGTPYYVSAVWYGYDQPKAISTGASNPAGHIFAKVYNTIHKNLTVKDFSYPNSKAKQTRYCTYSGMIAGSSCYSTSTAYFTSGYDKVCDGNHNGSVLLGGNSNYSYNYNYTTSANGGSGQGGENVTEEGTTLQIIGGEDNPATEEPTENNGGGDNSGDFDLN